MLRFAQLTRRKCELEVKEAALRADIQALSVACRKMNRRCKNENTGSGWRFDEDLYWLLQAAARRDSYLLMLKKPQSWEPPYAELVAAVGNPPLHETLSGALQRQLTHLKKDEAELAEQETAVLDRIIENVEQDIRYPWYLSPPYRVQSVPKSEGREPQEREFWWI